MSSPLVIRLYRDGQLLSTDTAQGTVELGRRREDELAPLGTCTPRDAVNRIVIADGGAKGISRRHALVEPVDAGRVRVANVSAVEAIDQDGGVKINAGRTATLSLPCLLSFGTVVVRIDRESNLAAPLERLGAATIPPGNVASFLGSPAQQAFAEYTDAEADSESLMRWLYAAIDVVQSAATEDDFFARAAAAVVEVGGLDFGLVLLRDAAAGWKMVARTGADSENIRPSQRVLAELLAEKRTLWMSPDAQATASLANVEGVVAAPLLAPQGIVLGALYGVRRMRENTAQIPAIRRIEALVVELLASGAAAGLARLEQQRAAIAMRVRFEQFFTAELARELEAEPTLLDSRDADVSVLFADIRGFSRISERIGPRRTVEWILDVMQTLSEAVLAHEGVVVDYIGDELMAMWGAPRPEAQHAATACRAAVAMIEALPAVSERWRSEVGEATTITIGISSGPAVVGNIGSQQKFKYGPLGTTVNLASRVQGIAKYLGTNIAVTDRTREAVGHHFSMRRLCRTRVVNLDRPVNVYQPQALAPDQHKRLASYEAALAALEAGSFAQCRELLAQLIAADPQDGPTRWLASRLQDAEAQPREAFDPVWNPPGK